MAEIYIQSQEGRTVEVAMETAFPFLKEKKHVISLVGAGGKTTLMYTLAEEYRRRGYRVLVTTTTHILKPEEAIFARNTKEVEKLWEQGQIAVVGEQELCRKNPKKLRSPEEGWLRQLICMADVALVEADGAKRKPCKVPNDTEPVLLPESDIVIGVMGLDAIGQTLRESCFRLEEVVNLLGKEEESVITEEIAAEILLSDKGTRKKVGDRAYYAVLNKCDSQKQKESGEKIMRLMRAKGMERAVLATARGGSRYAGWLRDFAQNVWLADRKKGFPIVW